MIATQSMKVVDFMTKGIITLTPDMDVMNAMQKFVDYQISGAPVVDARGNLVGILTERDCLKTFLQTSYYGNGGGGKVEEYMSVNVETIDSGVSLMDVAELLSTKKYRRYPVMENNRVVGLISRRDVLKALLTMNR